MYNALIYTCISVARAVRVADGACTGPMFQVALQLQRTATPAHVVRTFFDLDSLNRTYTPGSLADVVLGGCDGMVALCTRPKFAVMANDKRTIVGHEGMDLVASRRSRS